MSIEDGRGVDFVFVPALPARAAIAILLALAGLVAWIGVLSLVLRRRAGARLAHWLSAVAPLRWIAVVALGLLAALPGIGARVAVLTFFCYDLRWWWLALALAVSAWRAVRATTPAGARDGVASSSDLATSLQLVGYDALVAAVAMIFACVTTPNLRFTGVLHGDEGKYLRYCETLYQGQGFDIMAKRPMDEQPIDASSHLGRNFALLASALGEDARLLAADLRSFGADPFGFRWNRARGGSTWFLTGRNGRTYQVHTPGLSFLLLPGYFLDRYVLSTTPGYQNEFPADLTATNASLLALDGLFAVALFRLLRHVVSRDALAASLALAVMLALPMSDFAFQIYPEVAAGLFTTASCTIVFFGRDRSGRVWAAAGAAAGALVWLHPRFLLVSVTLAALAIALGRGARRRVYVAAWAAAVAAFCLYAYHLTGSFLPTALYDAPGTADAFDPAAVPVNLFGLVFDRTWGLLPLAPILAVAPAAFLAQARSQRSSAVAALLLIAVLAATGAGHGLSAAGATPGRYIVATLPLIAWPIAFAWSRLSGASRMAFGVLAGLTIETAAAYNASHFKDVGPIHDALVSGWRLALIFPARGEPWTAAQAGTVLLSILAMGWIAWRWLRTPSVPAPAAAASRAISVGVAAVAVVVLLNLAAGSPTSADLRMPADDARRLVREGLGDRTSCALCTASQHGMGVRALGTYRTEGTGQ